MNTVLEILNKTMEFFQKKGVPDARLDAQYILAHGLKMKRMDLYLNFDRPLTAGELDALRPLVARRANREPLQHIIGSTSFRGHEILCDRRALIPRPETESLVDLLKERLAGREKTLVADIGTGTGAIAIATAKEIPGTEVIATDISRDALALARENAEKNSAQITFYEGDLLAAIPAERKLQAIVSNPPYIPDSEKERLQREVRDFDPSLALFGGTDGLAIIRNLLKQTADRLEAGSPVLLEIGSEQADTLKAEAVNYPWLEWTGALKDFCGNIRFVEYRAK
ncbi:MAG: peptide chain release factor N(5)-glutamine methyltransferase [Fibrobacteraceae bacterium]